MKSQSLYKNLFSCIFFYPLKIAQKLIQESGLYMLSHNKPTSPCPALAVPNGTISTGTPRPRWASTTAAALTHRQACSQSDNAQWTSLFAGTPAPIEVNVWLSSEIPNCTEAWHARNTTDFGRVWFRFSRSFGVETQKYRQTLWIFLASKKRRVVGPLVFSAKRENRKSDKNLNFLATSEKQCR
jgi:hypothetical protein